MKGVLPEDLHADIDRIKPTVWQDRKTDAIDFDSDFIWFDNDIFASELKVLEKCREGQSAFEVNLRDNPKQLIEIVRDVL